MSQIIIVLYRNLDIFHVVVDHQMAVHVTVLLDLLSTINILESFSVGAVGVQRDVGAL